VRDFDSPLEGLSLLAAEAAPSAADAREALAGAVRELSVEDARAVAAWALAALDDPAATLELIAAFVPDALDGLHATLLERSREWPPELFRGAPPDVARELAERAAHSEERWPLRALAWVGCGTAVTYLARWREAPPPSLSSERIDDELPLAGWHLTEDGQRRDLFHGECFALVEGCSGPVRVAGPHPDACRWCGTALRALVDLDLSDERLSFAGGGPRVSIPFCERCWAGPLCELDGDGIGRWSDATPARTPPDGAFERLPAEHLGLGPRRSPFEASDLRPRRIAQLGGFPAWEQWPEHPPCPRCARPMPFLAQVSVEELAGGPAEGTFYALFCADCRTGGVVYQQT
jgi:hypothetical protein